MPDPAGRLRPWSALSESEQTELTLAYQPLLDGEALTRGLERKLGRMQVFLEARGASITEGEIRSAPRRESRA
jgi:hypothetical protein